MLNSAQKAFINLCESVTLVEEPSKVAAALGTGMAAKAITKFIHRKLQLSDKAEVKQLNGLPDWKYFKNNNAWLVIVGDSGMAALRAVSERYSAGAVKLGSDDIKTITADQISQIKAFIKEYVGKPQKYFAIGYVEGTSKWSYPAGNKFSNQEIQRKRADAKRGVASNNPAASYEGLLKKFRPLFAKIVKASEVDVQGMVGNMIKAGNYSGAENKIARLKELRDAHAYLAGDTDPDDYSSRYKKDQVERMLRNKLTRAVKEASIHLYANTFADPDEPTEDGIQKATKQLFADISSGDTKKLSALLWYLKNGFVR